MNSNLQIEIENLTALRQGSSEFSEEIEAKFAEMRQKMEDLKHENQDLQDQNDELSLQLESARSLGMER